VVRVTSAVSSEQVKRGAAFQITVALDIQGGYHINSNRPLEEYLIPTSLKLDKTTGITLGPVRYPRAAMRRFKFSNKALSVYEGRVVLSVSGRVLASLSPGRHIIRGKLTVQACNDEACLRPKTVSIEIPVQVV
jgi:hypothetical protein